MDEPNANDNQPLVEENKNADQGEIQEDHQ